jgi:hypothetical protein
MLVFALPMGMASGQGDIMITPPSWFWLKPMGQSQAEVGAAAGGVYVGGLPSYAGQMAGGATILDPDMALSWFLPFVVNYDAKTNGYNIILRDRPSDYDKSAKTSKKTISYEEVNYTINLINSLTTSNITAGGYLGWGMLNGSAAMAEVKTSDVEDALDSYCQDNPEAMTCWARSTKAAFDFSEERPSDSKTLRYQDVLSELHLMSLEIISNGFKPLETISMINRPNTDFVRKLIWTATYGPGQPQNKLINQVPAAPKLNQDQIPPDNDGAQETRSKNSKTGSR